MDCLSFLKASSGFLSLVEYLRKFRMVCGASFGF